MDIKEKREYAKSLGIKQTHNMKAETLDKKIAELNLNDGVDVDTSEDVKGYLKRCGFNFKALKRYAKELGGDKATYRARKKAFECSKEGQFLDFLTVAMFQ